MLENENTRTEIKLGFVCYAPHSTVVLGGCIVLYCCCSCSVCGWCVSVGCVMCVRACMLSGVHWQLRNNFIKTATWLFWAAATAATTAWMCFGVDATRPGRIIFCVVPRLFGGLWLWPFSHKCCQSDSWWHTAFSASSVVNVRTRIWLLPYVLGTRKPLGPMRKPLGLAGRTVDVDVDVAFVIARNAGAQLWYIPIMYVCVCIASHAWRYINLVFVIEKRHGFVRGRCGVGVVIACHAVGRAHYSTSNWFRKQMNCWRTNATNREGETKNVIKIEWIMLLKLRPLILITMLLPPLVQLKIVHVWFRMFVLEWYELTTL